MSKPSACVYVDQNNLFFRYKKLDFKELYSHLNENYNLLKVTSYMAYDHNNDAQKKFLTYLSNNGYKCKTTDITQQTDMDHIMIVDIIMDIKNIKTDFVVLISGDGHFSYCLDSCSNNGIRTHIVGSKDYISFDLLKVADKLTYIENIPKVIIQ